MDTRHAYTHIVPSLYPGLLATGATATQQGYINTCRACSEPFISDS